MQYPQIQFYRGSLVRLASGKLKQVEDLSSDDFIESARLIRSPPCTSISQHLNSTIGQSNTDLNNNNINNNSSSRLNFNRLNRRPTSLLAVDENNNSVFNSPEPTPSFDSPTMELMETDEEEVQIKRERNIVDEDDDDDDEELVDVVSGGDDHEHTLNLCKSSTAAAAAVVQLNNTNNNNTLNINYQHNQLDSSSLVDGEDLYIDSSVVRDFLEVGPPSSASPTSSTSSSYTTTTNNNHPTDLSITNNTSYPSTSTSSSTSPRSLLNISPPAQNLTVLIKFFLESSRTIVFIEVPIEHPFFVFHRGWSSWNPQRTYDKFGLKCRKLKIGDTCISLIRRQRKQQPQQQQESDQCNILFSSIKINE